MKLSLIIPCFNEARNLPLLIGRLREAFRRPDIEVILVDNGSTDETPGLLSKTCSGEESIRSVRVDVNQGYGFGILSGLSAARGEILGWTHADMQTDPADVLAGLELFETNADPARLFIKGRRYGRALGDTAFTVGMSIFETLLMGRPLWDINAQPTMFPRSLCDSWDIPPHDFSLDLFAYYMAKRLGYEVQRIPVRFGERAHGVSHWNVDWKAKAKFIRRTVDYSFRLRKRMNTRSV